MGSGRVQSLADLSGITAADQSPTIPTKYLEEEKDLTREIKGADEHMEHSNQEETRIENAESKLSNFIQEEMSAIESDVKSLNLKDTDEIESIVPIVGAPGPPGMNGANGHDGDEGLVGPQGAKGRQGPQGPAGQIGSTGPQGEVGSIGKAGPDGLQGIVCSPRSSFLP